MMPSIRQKFADYPLAYALNRPEIATFVQSARIRQFDIFSPRPRIPISCLIPCHKV